MVLSQEISWWSISSKLEHFKEMNGALLESSPKKMVEDS
ncbi:hypothetical protein KR49_08530 [Synechococcus sp. KORDI-49]|nr:hypothetical protein KR49_08530 [Synechococcus sp. KORDI-49]